MKENSLEQSSPRLYREDLANKLLKIRKDDPEKAVLELEESKETLEYKEGLEYSAKVRLAMKTKGWYGNISYEEAILRTDQKIAREKFVKDFGVDVNSADINTDERRIAAKQISDLSNAAFAVNYLNSIDGEPKDEIPFIKNVGMILNKKLYKLFPLRSTQDRITGLGEIILEKGDYLTKIGMLEAYDYLGLSESNFNKFKNKFIKDGDTKLYLDLVGIAKKQVNQEDLIKLGKQAILNESPSDALEAFKIAKDDNLIEDGNALEMRKKLEAEKKEKMMPDGFLTKNLISHTTSFSNLPSVLLRDGVLSGAEMKKRNINKLSGYGDDLQNYWGAYNYISTWNPWSGVGTSPDHINLHKKLRQKFEEFVEPYAIRIDYDHMEEKEIEKNESNSIVYYKPHNRGSDRNSDYQIEINENFVTNPKYEDFFNKLDNVFKDGIAKQQISEEQPSFYEYNIKKSDNIISSHPINPMQYFHANSTPVLLVNPLLERYNFPAKNTYGPESFIKGAIEPRDIIGIVLPAEVTKDKIVFPWALKLAKQSGTPLYISKRTFANNSDEIKNQSIFFSSDLFPESSNSVEKEYSFEKIWPKE